MALAAFYFLATCHGCGGGRFEAAAHGESSGQDAAGGEPDGDEVPLDAAATHPDTVLDAAADTTGAGTDITLPSGKLVFHRFTSYATGDSEMFIVASPTKAMMPEIGRAYGLCNPLNGIFSPDGNQLAVMAQPRTATCGPTDRNQMDVYLLDLVNVGQKRQVTMNALPDEDPQFAASGQFIVFKHNGHLAQWTLGAAPFTTCASLPTGAYCFNLSTGEQSKPVITPDDKSICYFEQFDANSDIYCFDRAAGLAGKDINAIRIPAVVHPLIEDARPTIAEGYLYYQRWRAATNPTMIIARKALDDLTGVGSIAQFCTDMAASYSEPYDIGGGRMIFSSDEAGLGKRDLFIGDFDALVIQSLDRWMPGINTSKQEVGASFFAQ